MDPNVDFYKLNVRLGAGGSKKVKISGNIKTIGRKYSLIFIPLLNFEIFLILKWPFSVNYSQGGIFLKFYDVYCVGNNIFM